MDTRESDIQTYDNETGNETVAEIMMVTEKDSKTTDPANQAKSATYSILPAEHHNNKGYTGHELGERCSEKSTTPGMTGNPTNGRNPGVKSHTAKDSAETIKDDTGNASNKNSDSVR